MAGLLEAAVTLFAEKGYDAVTMTEVAARAGAPIGSLYQFFPSKESLADAFLDRFSSRVDEARKEIGARTSTLTLPELAGALLGLMDRFQSCDLLEVLSHIAEDGVSRYTGCGNESLLRGNAMATASTVTTDLPSGQEWKDMLEELLPPQGRWSEEEYLLLTDHRNRLVEFTDGFLEVLPMPTDKHQSVLKFLLLPFTYSSRSAGPLQPRRYGFEFGQASTVSPTFLCSFQPPIRAAKIVSGQRGPRPEVVSEDNPERDLVEKRGDYAEGGILEY